MNVRYIVELDEAERQELVSMTSSGAPGARKMKRAQILLMADAGQTDEAIAQALHVGTSTVYRTKRRFVEEGLDSALKERARPGGERKLDAQQEAMLVALACSKPPKGRRRRTLHLLAEELVALAELGSLSHETVRRGLAENELKPWQKKMWCLPKVDAGFVAQMEDILDLYAEPPDPKSPVVCFDETRCSSSVRRECLDRCGRASPRSTTTSTSATAQPTSSSTSIRTAAGGMSR